MARRSFMAAFGLILTLTRAAAAADPPLSHIRSTESALLDALDAAVRRSPTFRDLVRRIEDSDLVVYVRYAAPRTPNTAGRTAFLSVAGGLRYVVISIDPRLMGCACLVLLGHELRHAMEIAEAGFVLDERSLESFYRNIGFKASAGCDRCFESHAAIAAGQRIQREVLANREGVAGRRPVDRTVSASGASGQR